MTLSARGTHKGTAERKLLIGDHVIEGIIHCGSTAFGKESAAGRSSRSQSENLTDTVVEVDIKLTAPTVDTKLIDRLTADTSTDTVDVAMIVLRLLVEKT